MAENQQELDEEKVKPQWEHRPLRIQDKTIEVIRLAHQATTLQVEILRKRLQKLQRGVGSLK